MRLASHRTPCATFVAACATAFTGLALGAAPLAAHGDHPGGLEGLLPLHLLGHLAASPWIAALPAVAVVALLARRSRRRRLEG